MNDLNPTAVRFCALLFHMELKIFFVCTYLKEEHGLGQYSDSDAATFILMSN